MENVELKRKVTLKRKEEKTEIPPPPKQSKWWLLLVVLVIIVAIIILCVNKCSSNSDESSTVESTKMEQLSTAPTDEGQDAEDALVESKEVSSGEIENVAKEAEVPQTEPTAENKPIAETSFTVKPETKPIETSRAPLQGNLDEKAKQVIRGDYGNGGERKQKLGNEYKVIQQRVNELYRLGEVN